MKKMTAAIVIWCSVCGQYELEHIDLPLRKCRECGSTTEWKIKSTLGE